MTVTLHTSEGDLKFVLFTKEVPKLSYNFLALAAANKYDNSKFHRNLKGFIIQGGSPAVKAGDKWAKRGLSIWNKLIKDDFHPALGHNSRGILSMANYGPDTIGSQFFITYGPQLHLDKKYSVIGKMIEGYGALAALEALPVQGVRGKPITPIFIKSATIHYNPFAN